MVTTLLNQIPGVLASVTADGAYDGEPVYRAIAARQPDSPPAVIIPLRATAVLRPATGAAPSLCDRHIRQSERRVVAAGRAVSYGQRSLVERAMFRYKTLIGPALRARQFSAQKVEVHVVCCVKLHDPTRDAPLAAGLM